MCKEERMREILVDKSCEATQFCVFVIGIFMVENTSNISKLYLLCGETWRRSLIYLLELPGFYAEATQTSWFYRVHVKIVLIFVVARGGEVGKWAVIWWFFDFIMEPIVILCFFLKPMVTQFVMIAFWNHLNLPGCIIIIHLLLHQGPILLQNTLSRCLEFIFCLWFLKNISHHSSFDINMHPVAHL